MHGEKGLGGVQSIAVPVRGFEGPRPYTLNLGNGWRGAYHISAQGPGFSLKSSGGSLET